MARHGRGRVIHLLIVVICCVTVTRSIAEADDRPEPAGDASAPVAVLVGADADKLERFAADELCSYLERLFGIRTHPATNLTDNLTERVDAFLLVGSPNSNPAVAEALQSRSWPELSDQGIALKRGTLKDKAALIIGAGSPKATMWAVYETVERWGVQYLIDGDVCPPKREWAGLPNLDVVMEPNMRVRCWRLVNDLAHGPVSWSLDENVRFLRQMAKLKYNRIHTYLWPHQPFVHYTFRGMPKPPGVLFFGQRHPIDQDTIGREKFKGMSVFTNPEFVNAETPEELHRRAVALVRGIHEEARRLGMETVVSFEPFNWPKEFLKVMPAAQQADQLGRLTIQPGEEQSLDDPLLREMVIMVVRAYIETYPNADFIQVGVPEKRRWLSQGREAYRRLDQQYDLSGLESYDELCARARSRTSFPGGGGRVERQVKGDLAILWLFDSLVRTADLLERPGGGEDVKLIYSSVTEELFPLVARITPSAGEVVNFIDYTASRVLRHRELIRQTPTEDVPVSLILTLADDNVGVLPQLATGTFHRLLPELRQSRWAGFYTRYWTVGEQDPAVYYLARASWDESFTPAEAYTRQLQRVCGPASVEPALQSFKLIEGITLGMDQHGLGFGFPVPGMMTKHYRAGGLSAAIKKDHQLYREALEHAREAYHLSRPEGRAYMNYFVGRLKFAVRYLDAADAFGATANALKANNSDEARRHVDVAYAAIRDALQIYADVAKDHGDLGAVALMNEYCYRPIREKRKELRE